jgi:hypothetical protein
LWHNVVWTREQDESLKMTGGFRFCDFHDLKSIPSMISLHRNKIFRFQSVSRAHIWLLPRSRDEDTQSRPLTSGDARLSSCSGGK